jgi:hypothetical protein
MDKESLQRVACSCRRQPLSHNPIIYSYNVCTYPPLWLLGRLQHAITARRIHGHAAEMRNLLPT